MQSLQSVMSAFAVLLLCCSGSFGQRQEASCPKPKRGEPAVLHHEYLNDYIARVGMKLDCYFTFEQMPREIDNWIEMHDVKVANDPSSIGEMVEELSAQLKGVQVYRSKENPAVVHIIDERLEKENDYSLPKRVAVSFHGTPVGLVDKLQSPSLDNIRIKSTFLTHEPGNDDATQIHLSTIRTSVRNILTNWLPLSRYNVILWIAETRRTKDKLDTTIQFLGQQPVDGKGPIGDSPLPLIENTDPDAFDYASGVPKINGVIPFDYGEIAYYNNPDPDKEKLRVNLVNQAITFIDERLQANKPLQVRWAMFYLGKRKAKEGVPVLLKYLDYRYTTCGILEESYPAVRALTQIGQPAADAAFDDLVGKEQSDLRVRLLAAVVGTVDGPKPAQDRLEKALAGAKDDAQKKRLKLALKWLDDEKE